MSQFDNLSKAELEAKLKELKDLLEEVKEERGIILGQENIHLLSDLVTKYAKEIEKIETDIKAVEGLLAAQK